ncbi:beta-glucuronidase [Paenalkalicoccus suaedae]|uniref:Beta-glucuronidase n=1 Tax=Paenalkalicoccus suaedae TaxID=2592382 RepID=A0A859FIK1_9BACI|nr:beta-glucuronidase [Paenalkalicoccus suaedae]QKS72502.1 beta-glucuronidase [Paenalkalicoccus suaedae]
MLYPIFTETRGVLNLGGIWEFKLDDGRGLKDKWFEQKLTDTIPMAVPASFNDIGVSGEIKNHVGDVWYETEITIPKVYKNERLVLRIGAATHKASVYVDGVFVAEHKGGFLPFEVELSSDSEKAKRRITIVVNNIIDDSTLPVGVYEEEEVEGIGKVVRNMPNFDFFNYAGLQRPIKLYTTPRSYIKDIELVPQVTTDGGLLSYRVSTVLESVEEDYLVVAQLIDEEGKNVATGEGLQGEMSVSDLRRWEPLNAYLYTFKATIMKGEQLIDTYEEPIGFRSVEVRDGKFLINDKPFYFKGFGKHEDSPIAGRGFNEAVNVMDLRLMKWMGANSFRTAHYPYSEELMRLADREGIVVIDETPAVGVHLNFSAASGGFTKEDSTWSRIKTFDHHKDVLNDMIARDKNHACVVMWSVANEAATEEEGAYEYFKPLVELTRERDPQSRPVMIVTFIKSTPELDKIADLIDVLGFNRYYGWYENSGELDVAKVRLAAELAAWEKRCPGKPMMMTEYGADTIAGYHEIVPTMFTEEYQSDYLKINHEVFDQVPTFIGEHVWNFADFATSQNVRRVNGNKKGVFTRERKPKNAAHELRKRWTAIDDFYYKT